MKITLPSCMLLSKYSPTLKIESLRSISKNLDQSNQSINFLKLDVDENFEDIKENFDTIQGRSDVKICFDRFKETTIKTSVESLPQKIDDLSLVYGEFVEKSQINEIKDHIRGLSPDASLKIHVINKMTEDRFGAPIPTDMGYKICILHIIRNPSSFFGNGNYSIKFMGIYMRIFPE